MAWRKWRKQLLQRRHLARDARAARASCATSRYDLVLDLQGLLKSALWARQAGGPVAGYDRASIREPLARLALPAHAPPCRATCTPCSAAACWRRRTWAMPLPDDGARLRPARAGRPAGRRAAPYAVLIPNASRPEKLWPERHWVAVGRRLRERGLDAGGAVGQPTRSRRWPSASPPAATATCRRS